MKRNNKLSVVIAAFNEGPRIDKVLKAVCNHPLVSEVIVVNDGSVDDTVKVARRFKTKIINNKHNLGKTLSVKKGAEEAENEIILLLDADLIGLKPKHIKYLAEPVLLGKYDFTLSLRDNSFRTFKIMGIDFVSGERCLRKKDLLSKEIFSKPRIGFSLEVLMNKSFLKKRLRFQSVYLEGLKITHKSEKLGFWQGVWGEIKMVYQISRALPFWEVLYQMVKMAYLNKKYRKSNK